MQSLASETIDPDMTLSPAGSRMPRRSILRSAATFATAGIGAAATLSLTASSRRDLESQLPLYSETVAFVDAGVFTRTSNPLAPGAIRGVRRTAWKSGSVPLVPGTRVQEDAVGLEALVHATEGFMNATRLAGSPDPDLEASALLDLHSLTWALPSPIAGWSNNWRYTWPRDAAHVLVALHERGQTEWALDLLEGLARMQRPDGSFHARYIPGTNRTPDDRPAQFDGVGWLAWAAGRVLAKGTGPTATTSPAASASPQLVRALKRAADALMAATETRSHLPAASPDYWEKHEWQLPLSVAAMTLAGLRACTRLANASVIDSDGSALAARADAVDDAIARSFGRHGYQRYRRGGGADAGLLMLLPPYATAPAAGIDTEDRAFDLLEGAFDAMSRPAGGVAPAASWKRDGVSWTPQTAMFARAFAGIGALDEAESLLSWLANHRTQPRSLSEKVLANGIPATVSPLAWPAATTLSTLTALKR